MENRSVNNEVRHMIEIEVSPTDYVEVSLEEIKTEPSDDNVSEEEVDTSKGEYLESITHIKCEIKDTEKSPTQVQSSERIEQSVTHVKKDNCKGQRKSSNSNVRPLVCPECSKCFRYLSDLKRHSVTHTSDRPYVCDICHKRFNRPFNLKEHLRIHCGEKPYYCNMCDKRFGRLFDLKIHSFIHSGERPYKCSICQKDFNNSSNLSKHIKTHSK